MTPGVFGHGVRIVFRPFLRRRDLAQHSVVEAVPHRLESLILCGEGSTASLRPTLWTKIVFPIIVNLLTTAISLACLFGFFMVPQANYIQDHWHWPNWLAWACTILFLLAICALINMVIFLLLFGFAQSQLLRSVLQERGVLQSITEEHGTVHELNCCRDLAHQFLFLLIRLPLLIVTLPLHSFPVVGSIVWCVLNGWLYTWSLTSEYIVMADPTAHSLRSQWPVVRNHFGMFTSFGATAMGLELIPLVGPWLFFATNSCGAGFLCARLYSESHKHDGTSWSLLLQTK